MTDKTYRVVKSDVTEMNEKIRKHRKKILKWIILLAVLIILLAAGFYIYMETRVYSDYEVIKTMEREDSIGTQFAEFSGNLLKYGKDGAVYLDSDNKLIWNQTYEIQEPIIDICQQYLVIAEKRGKQIFIMDTKGPCGKIETTMPIQRVQVANQGTIAVLMEQDGTGYIQVYDKEGNFLAEGERHTKNGGYPLDLTLSDDGKKMAISLLDVNSGSVKTTISFYNFGSVGQNEIDNIVGTYSYDTVFPKVEFLTNDIMVAFGEQSAVIFEGTQRPQVKKEISLKKEVRSIFYNDAYIGLVFNNDNAKKPYKMSIYDLRGEEVFSVNYSMEYNEISFLENDEICIRNDLECAIYNLRGVERFHCNFKENIWKVMSTARSREYIILTNGATQRIRLK